MQECEEVLLREGGPEGFAREVRGGDEPSVERIEQVIEALKQLATVSGEWDSIPRQLACALYVLSFHLSGEVAGAEAYGRKFSEQTTELLPQMYELIDEVFGVLDD